MYLKQLNFYGERYNEFPFNLSFLKNLNEIVFSKNVTFITGENGSGKSTLIETIAELLDLNMEGGSKNNTFATYDSYSNLSEKCRLIRYPSYPKDLYFYRAESFYNLVSDLDYLGVSDELFDQNLHNFSRGESIKNLIKNRFFGNGLYLLDEPETGLSLQSQLELLVMIYDLVDSSSQFIICTHSPILMMYPNADILEFDDNGISNVTIEKSKIIEQWEMVLKRKEVFISQLFDG
ncbi:ATP-binding cassette domain-containing protein [Enterococcus sp. BWT-B8]|uniref:AAA family ATPase n=1 Tax=unclassified Enterococcus TaxID=2608891 RepID=UPI001E49E1B8|nr:MULTISPECIES: AAA family ATPase [unclassified Enterococcus]MCB5950909.1 ATP-binding cassette domain-containing protein [Enterococcus sp. BWT-B8]MCB5955545.1 ATP-binding cassette domain-containing protein [Enterococcus sp. CWB-B31]